jgi:hypothetical protein
MVQTPDGPRPKHRWAHFEERGREGFYDKGGAFHSKETIKADRMVLTTQGPRPTYVQLYFPEGGSHMRYYDSRGDLWDTYPLFGHRWRGPLSH